MRRLLAAAILVALLLPVAYASAHSGDGEASVEVEPAAVTAGETVTLAGSGLEPDSDRVLMLAGDELLVEFGTVRTDALGMFTKELTIPAHLPSGTYEVRAIGDETLTASLGITAAAGASGAGATGSSTGDVVTARSRPPVEMAAILLSALVIVAAGVFVAWRAERVGQALRPAPHG